MASHQSSPNLQSNGSRESSESSERSERSQRSSSQQQTHNQQHTQPNYSTYYGTSTVSLEDCDDMYKTHKNPLTNKQLSLNSRKYKRLDKHCKSLANHPDTYIGDIVNKWLKNPTRDPIDYTKIIVSNSIYSTYYKMYDMAYNYLYNKYNADVLTIKEKLPQNHLLFQKKIDVLFYHQIVKTEDAETINSVLKGYEPYCQYVSRIVEYYGWSKCDFHKIEMDVIQALIMDYSKCVSEYIRYAILFLQTDFNDLENYVYELKFAWDMSKFVEQFFKKTDKEYFEKFAKSFNKKKEGIVNNIFTELEHDIHYEDLEHVEQMIDNVVSGDFFTKLIKYYEELYNVYNGKYDPINSPFKNINNQTFQDIEDPLVSVLQKIGVQNIDLATLKIPKRPFKDDAEWQKYHTTYSKLSTQYREDVHKWQLKLDEATTAKQSTPPRPDKPTMSLPNNRVIDVTREQFPYYIKDQQYQTILKTYDDSKPIIDLYKKLVDEKLLSLLKKADPDASYDPSNLPILIDKDREYFTENVLRNDELSKSSRQIRCSDNTDVISSDNLAKKKYPLAKLNMMFQLQTKYDNGDIRTDCFYAPNFYKHIVAKRMQDLPVTNPVTNEPLKLQQIEKAMDDIMKIMRVVDPNIQDLNNLLPAYDEGLTMTHHTIHRGNYSYNSIYIVRTLCDIPFEVHHLCVVPDDINREDTGSVDLTSAVYLQKIYQLFNDKELLHTYLPPYQIYHRHGAEFIKPNIDFSSYDDVDDWKRLTKENRIAKFMECCQQLNRYV